MSKNTVFKSLELSFLPTHHESTTPAIRPRVRTRNLTELLVVILPFALMCHAPAQQAGSVAAETSVKSSAIAASYGKLPLAFEVNRGQTDPQVRFLSHGNGYSLFLTDSAAVLALTKPGTTPAPFRMKTGCPILVGGCIAGKGGLRASFGAKKTKTDVVRMELTGASKGLRVTGDGKLPGKANYFTGSDPAKWHSNVPTYAKVKYAGVYPGVDLVYYGNQGQLEYDFVVAPHADAKPIRLHFAGASRLKLDADGNLRVAAKDGEIAFHKPVVYQQIDGRRRDVEGQFKLLAENTVSFTLGSYQRDKSLVIDPTLAYSTYLGGSVQDGASGIAVDLNGNVYVTGSTNSSDFPRTPGAFQSAIVGTDAFITKLNPAGTALIYSTYLTESVGQGIAVDAGGDAFIAGTAFSNGFPVTIGAFQTAPANGFAGSFVTKLNPSGSGLIYSTYVSGTIGDGAAAIAVDAQGNAFITGTAQSGFPVTPGAFQTVNNGAPNGGPNAYVTKVNPVGSALVYSTYLGGNTMNGPDGANGIALDSAGDAYVTGQAWSTDFPVTSGAFQTTNNAGGLNGGINAFITKVNPTGTALLYSTYLGGSPNPLGGDLGNSIAVDRAGNAYVAGSAASTNFPVTSGAFQTVNNAGGAAFITKLNPTGSALVFSTYLGGTNPSGASSIAIDAAGNVYTAGSTSATDFPLTSNAFQTVNKAAAIQGSTAFVTKLNPLGTALLYSTYLGGSNNDGASGIATDTIGDAYVAGGAFSHDFPVTGGAFQMVNKTPNGSSGVTGFVSKFGLAPVDFSQPGVSFGNVLVGTRTHGVSITATNYTNSPADYLSGSNLGQFHIALGSCGPVSPGGSLAGGASCTFEVWFAPTQAGPVTGSFTVSTVKGPVTFIMTGTGILPHR